MKKIAKIAALAIFGAMAMTSCKKDYTCTCTDADGEKFTFEIKDAKKKDAKSACDTWGTLYTLAGGSCSI